MDLPPTNRSENEEFMIKINKQCVSFMPMKNYPKVIAKKISVFLKFSKTILSQTPIAAVRRNLCLMITFFALKQLWIHKSSQVL